MPAQTGVQSSFKQRDEPSFVRLRARAAHSAHAPRHARGDAAEQLIRYGRGRRGDLLDGQVRAPQTHGIAAARARLRAQIDAHMSMDTRAMSGTRWPFTSTGVPLRTCRG